MQTETLERLIGHSFKNKALLQMALTHSSMGQGDNYERLEFLGDRVLGLIVAELLYHRFPTEQEGDLAKRLAALVQGSFLAEKAQDIHLGDYILFSDSEASSGGAENQNILADVFEALLGALYLDAGFESCKTLVQAVLGEKLDIMIKPPQHPKTRLQEWAQGQGLALPVYKITDQHGPDHAPLFDIELHVQGYKPFTAQGRSRQMAEKEVAHIFLEHLETDKPHD